MALSTAARNTSTELIYGKIKATLKGSTTAYQGTVASVNTTTGYVEPTPVNSTAASVMKCVGLFNQSYDNTGSTTGMTCEILCCAAILDNGTSTQALAQADVFNACYLLDDHTATKYTAGATGGLLLGFVDSKPLVYVGVK